MAATRLTMKTHSGDTFTATSPEQLIYEMKLLDWWRPPTIEQFKLNVQQRCSVSGTTFVYWDAMSFLLGYAEATNAELIYELGVKK